MILKPLYHDPLIDQLNSYVEAESAKEAPRRYVGASSIGEKCERKLWYQYRMPEKAQPTQVKGILAANDGHRSEDLMADYLRKMPGIQLWTHKSVEDDTQYGFLGLNGEFRGHLDGVIKGIPLAPATAHVWEHKSKNERLYNELSALKNKFDIKQVLEKWNPVYYAQAVICMHYFNLSRHYMTVSSAGLRGWQSVRTDANPTLAEALIKKAERIIAYERAPYGISDNPAWYECKYCKFNHICFEK